MNTSRWRSPGTEATNCSRVTYVFRSALGRGNPRLGGSLRRDCPARAIPHHADFRSPQRRARRFLLAASASPEERLLTWVGYLGHALEDVLPASIQSPGREIVLESLTAAFARADHPASTSLSRALSVNWDTYLPEDLMVKADRCSMAHALELTFAFPRHRIGAVRGRLPDRLKVRGRTLKWVLKEAVRDLVPGSIRSRAKMGFGMPLAEWLRGPWRPLLEERILVSGALISEWVRPELVQSMARDHLSGRLISAHPLWALLTLDAWMRRHRSASDGLGKGRTMLDGKVVLVTGGTGSFGQRFIQTVYERFEPTRLVVFSRDELKQHEMLSRFPPEQYPTIRYFLETSRDRNRLYRRLRRGRHRDPYGGAEAGPACEHNPSRPCRPM